MSASSRGARACLAPRSLREGMFRVKQSSVGGATEERLPGSPHEPAGHGGHRELLGQGAPVAVVSMEPADNE